MAGKKGGTARAEGITWWMASPTPSMPGRLSRAVKGLSGAALKTSRVRKVYRLPPEAGEGALILKEYKPGGPFAFLRALFKGSPARREWLALSRLRSAGVAVPEAAALGYWIAPRWPGRTYLATRAIESDGTIEDLLLGKCSSPVSRRVLARALARLVRTMHDAGVLHLDLHAANILLDREGRPILLDLHGAHLTGRLSFRRRTRDLVSLAGAFLVHGTRTDRLRFFKAYSAGYEGFPDFKHAARWLEERSRDRLYDFFRKFDRRPLRPGHLFRSLRIHDLTGMGEPTERPERLSRILGPYPLDFLKDKGVLLHQSDWARIYSVRVDDARYVVKVYLRPGFKNACKRMFQGSKGGRCWVNYHRLLFRGFDVPKPVLFLEEPLHSPTGHSYVVTEEAVGYITLDRFVAATDRPNLESLRARLALTLARMHDLYLGNRDLKAQNILVAPSGHFLIIDPDGVEPAKEPSLYLMARDIMRLNASFQPPTPITTTDRLRFLKDYITHRRLPLTALRPLWREIYHLTWQKWDHWARRS